MRRGEIWWADLGERRPVVILSQDDAGDIRAMMIVPPSATEACGLAVEVSVGEGFAYEGVLRVALARPGFIPCTWLQTLARTDLIERVGSLSPPQLRQFEDALQLGGLDLISEFLRPET
jgi:mRNA interferase MazF